MSFKEFLSEVKSKALACFDNQAYQYEALIDELETTRDTSRNPLFDVLFSYQNFEPSELAFPEIVLKPYNYGNSISKFDLTLSAIDSGDQIFLNFEYSTAIFKKETVERFLAYFKKIISIILTDINKKISDIEIITEKEKQQLLYEFNDTSVAYPIDKTIVDLF